MARKKIPVWAPRENSWDYIETTRLLNYISKSEYHIPQYALCFTKNHININKVFQNKQLEVLILEVLLLLWLLLLLLNTNITETSLLVANPSLCKSTHSEKPPLQLPLQPMLLLLNNLWDFKRSNQSQCP